MIATSQAATAARPTPLTADALIRDVAEGRALTPSAVARIVEGLQLLKQRYVVYSMPVTPSGGTLDRVSGFETLDRAVLAAEFRARYDHATHVADALDGSVLWTSREAPG